MNCIFYKDGSEEIIYFLPDCEKKGDEYVGSNGEIIRAKEGYFKLKWTNSKPTPEKTEKTSAEASSYDPRKLPDFFDPRIRYIEKVSEIPACPVYRGEFCGTAADVDEVTEKLIREAYPLEEELKILRMKLASLDSANQFTSYNSFVEDLRAEAKTFKETYFSTTKEG